MNPEDTSSGACPLTDEELARLFDRHAIIGILDRDFGFAVQIGFVLHVTIPGLRSAETIDGLIAQFPEGRFYEREYGRSARFRFTGKSAERFLRIVHPHVSAAKRKQIDIALAFVETIIDGCTQHGERVTLIRSGLQRLLTETKEKERRYDVHDSRGSRRTLRGSSACGDVFSGVERAE